MKRGGSKTTLRGRHAGTGKFMTVRQARRQPKTTVVERVPKPGYGDTNGGRSGGKKRGK